MKYLPYDNFYIDTVLKPEEVQLTLEKEVAAQPKFLSFRRSGHTCYFKGRVLRDRFSFQPDITGFNSFNPQISGSISGNQSGSRVSVKMALNPRFSVFVCVTLFALMVAELVITLNDISKEKFRLPDLALLLMLVFVYLLATLAYKFESAYTKNKLVGLLGGCLTDVK